MTSLSLGRSVLTNDERLYLSNDTLYNESLWSLSAGQFGAIYSLTDPPTTSAKASPCLYSMRSLPCISIQVEDVVLVLLRSPMPFLGDSRLGTSFRHRYTVFSSPHDHDLYH